MEIRVGMRELKNKLSEYLRQVKAGEIIIITEHGKAIGQISPIKPTVRERMAALVSAGQMEWVDEKLPPVQPITLKKREGLLSDLVVEDRA